MSKLKRRNSIFLNEKGVTILLEQIFIILFGVLLLVMIITVFTALRDKSVNFVAGSQFESIGSYVHNGIIIADQDMRYSDTGKVFLDLPDKIGDTPYRISISNRIINVTDLNGAVNASIPIFNINATLAGNVSSGSGGRFFLIFNRTANTITLAAEERVIF